MENRIYRNDKGEIISVSGNLFHHKGKVYTIGTVIEVREFNHTAEKTYLGYKSGVGHEWRNESGSTDFFYPYFIIRIVEPVEYIEPPKIYVRRSFWDIISAKPHPANLDDFFYVRLLYILIMLVALIFKDRVYIWVVATLWYVGWKNAN